MAMSARTPAAEVGCLSLRQLLIARLRAGPTALLALAGLILVVVLVVATRGSLGGALTHGTAALAHANTTFLWIAGAGFAGSLIATARTWKTTIEACGARVSVKDACARYGVGSLVNTFAPMRLGDAARVVLLSRTLPQDGGRALTTGGALGAIGLSRALVQAVLVAVAASVGALPLWPVVALAGLAFCGLLATFLVRHRLPHRRIAHLLDAFHALARSPGRAASLLSWTAVAAVARVFAATAIAASLGAPWSLGTGLIITAALDLATTIPLTPGNVGIASGAVALALQAKGAPLATAVASGLAFHAVETAVGLTFGVAGALTLAHYPSPVVRRWGLRLAAAACAVLVVTGLSLSAMPGLA
jgi:uncharacterized membrane protein YbhN (UPF0104 family)